MKIEITAHEYEQLLSNYASLVSRADMAESQLKTTKRNWQKPKSNLRARMVSPKNSSSRCLPKSSRLSIPRIRSKPSRNFGRLSSVVSKKLRMSSNRAWHSATIVLSTENNPSIMRVSKVISMRLLLNLSLVLIPTLAQAAPYHRPIDLTNPYQEPVYTPLDEREYSTVRRQIAEVCQDLAWVLDHQFKGNHQADELRSMMDQCTADDMEWDALQACQRSNIPAPMCPVVEVLDMDVVFLRATIHAMQSQ